MARLEDAVFWIETDKIVPNPYQPRREFAPDALQELAESISQYGILQPLVVTRKEDSRDDGSISVAYELIAGERRLRASKLAGLREVPCIVRVGDDNRNKLELAIIENIQREDLNVVDRARSFQQLADKFNLSWADIGKKVGKSRPYVSNTVRILMLPQEILDAVIAGKITEGHTRPLLMLVDRPDEQVTLFKEIMLKKMNVRDAESSARRIAQDKVRKKEYTVNPEVLNLEGELAESLGTRVKIEQRENGGKITIDYFSHEELVALTKLIETASAGKTHEGMLEKIKKEINSASEEDLDLEPTSEEILANPENVKVEEVSEEEDSSENFIAPEKSDFNQFDHFDQEDSSFNLTDFSL